MLKYLRITVTALSLMACVLLIVLWVRSPNYIDRVVWHYNTPHAVHSTTTPGRINVGMFVDQPIVLLDGWGHNQHRLIWQKPLQSTRRYYAEPVQWNFGAKSGKSFASVFLPFWFLIVLSTLLAVVPWIKHRFSARALLIATTLVAVGLDMIVLS